MTIKQLVADIKANTDLTCAVMDKAFPQTFEEKLEMALEHMVEQKYIKITNASPEKVMHPQAFERLSV